jgi:hypothetical protein
LRSVSIMPFSAETVLLAIWRDPFVGRCAGCTTFAGKADDRIAQHFDGDRRNGITGMLLARLVAHQARLHQNFEMLRHCGLRQLHFADDLLAVAGIVTGQMPQNADTRRVRQRGEHVRQTLI